MEGRFGSKAENWFLKENTEWIKRGGRTVFEGISCSRKNCKKFTYRGQRKNNPDGGYMREDPQETQNT